MAIGAVTRRNAADLDMVKKRIGEVLHPVGAGTGGRSRSRHPLPFQKTLHQRGIVPYLPPLPDVEEKCTRTFITTNKTL